MKKILHVDNEPDTVEMVKAFLEGKGYEVVSAANGTEALEKVESETPDLVLLDIMMPDISGWDVYQQIRKSHPKLKVAFLSVIEVSQERKTKLMLSGLADYILKPFTSDELFERVENILGGEAPAETVQTEVESSASES